MQRPTSQSRDSGAPVRSRGSARGHVSSGAGPIVFALTRRGHSSAALRRALALARACETDLHALMVMPDFPRMRPHIPRRSFIDAIRSLECVVNDNRATAAWLARAGADGPPIERFSAVVGDFPEQVVRYCGRVGAQAIVVSSDVETPGSVVTALACSSGVPVLLAREGGGHATIVAATDLRDRDYPVLHKAAEMGHRLRAAVVAVHNVNPLAVVLPFDVDWPIVLTRSESSQRALVERLTSASLESNLGSKPVVHYELNPVAAIVGQARSCDADLVVVGARTQRWFDRPAFGSVASQVVNRAHCSVLVTPLRAGEPESRAD